MRLLFIDLETAPALGYFYQRYDVTIKPDQLVHNGFILSYQAAWNDGEVFTGSLKDKSYKNRTLLPQDDKSIVIEIGKLLEQADVAIGHNAVRFDVAKFNARLASHNMKPIAMPHIVDTLRVCRDKFKFEANSLDSVCQELGLGRKFHSGGYETTISCMKGDQSAWDKLLEYGKQDIVLLRDLYYRVRPFMTNHPNHNLRDNTLKSCCPTCGEYRLQSRGVRHTLTMTYDRYQCMGCGAWSQERKNNVDKEKRDVILKGC
jgi:hypothetical protein